MSRPSNTTCAVVTVAALTTAILVESLTVALLIGAGLVCLLLTPWLTWSPRSAPLEGSPAESEPPRVLIVSASIGAGHDGAATELAREARDAGYAVDRVDFLDLLPARLGPLMRAAYHWQIRLAPNTWGWLLARLQHRPDTGWAATLPGRLSRRRLLAACHARTELIVSTYPLASQALSQMRLDGSLSIPTVTYLTDLSVHPLWVAPGIDHHLALHEVSAIAALALGAHDVKVLGLRASPRFGPSGESQGHQARQRYGLPDDQRLALVVAGSWGVGDVATTARDLVSDGSATPVVACGSNSALLRSLQEMPGVFAFGWIDDMPDLMHACDLVIQNAGGLTSLEALASGLPVITYRALPGHGEMNAAALELAGWAPWARNLSALGDLITKRSTAPVIASPQVPWAELTGQPVLAHT